MTKKKVSKKNEVGVEAAEVDIFEGVELEEGDAEFVSESQEEDHPVVAQAPKSMEGKAPEARRLVGHHPITKEPVYR